MLFRQINPSFVSEGLVSSQAFTPTKTDEGFLSTHDSKIFTAETAHQNFVIKGRNSSGSMGLDEPEVQQNQLGIINDDKTFEGHTLIDFTPYILKKGEVKLKAKNLRDCAQKRGWLFQSS